MFPDILFDYLLLPDAQSEEREEKHRQTAVTTEFRKQRCSFNSMTEKQNAPADFKETQFLKMGNVLLS